MKGRRRARRAKVEGRYWTVRAAPPHHCCVALPRGRRENLVVVLAFIVISVAPIRMNSWSRSQGRGAVASQRPHPTVSPEPTFPLPFSAVATQLPGRPAYERVEVVGAVMVVPKFSIVDPSSLAGKNSTTTDDPLSHPLPRSHQRNRDHGRRRRRRLGRKRIHHEGGGGFSRRLTIVASEWARYQHRRLPAHSTSTTAWLFVELLHPTSLPARPYVFVVSLVGMRKKIELLG